MERDLTSGSVFRNVIYFSLPYFLSYFLQTLYGMADLFIVGQFDGVASTTAVSIGSQVMHMLTVMIVGLAMGATVSIGQSIGAGDKKRASVFVGNTVTLFMGISLVLAVLLLFFVKPTVAVMSTPAEAVSGTAAYLTICFLGIPFITAYNVISSIFRGLGDSKSPMYFIAVACVANIILDPFFIYGWCGLPAMGTTGAAIATVIGQAFGALAGFLFHHKHNKEVNIRLSDCRPDGHIILDIYRIGFPSILMVGIGSLTNYLMNRILMAFTSTAVALYGAYFKLQSFFFMPVFGLNNGIVPIVGYNYGARKKERIYRTIRYGVLYAVCILAVGLLLFEAIPGVLLQAFSPSEHMLAIGIPALRKIAIHFPIAAFCIVGGSVCQALGKSLYSFFTSVLRQVVALIPAAYLLSLTGNVGNVWWCFPIAEVVSACATAFFLRRALRNMDRELTLTEEQ